MFSFLIFNKFHFSTSKSVFFKIIDQIEAHLLNVDALVVVE